MMGQILRLAASLPSAELTSVMGVLGSNLRSSGAPKNIVKGHDLRAPHQAQELAERAHPWRPPHGSYKGSTV